MNISWRGRFTIAAILALLVAAGRRRRAIKLATVVPEGSIWDKNLKQMAEEWNRRPAAA